LRPSRWPSLFFFFFAALGIDPEKECQWGAHCAGTNPAGLHRGEAYGDLLSEMHRRQVLYGMVTMLRKGGMGAAGILKIALISLQNTYFRVQIKNGQLIGLIGYTLLRGEFLREWNSETVDK